MVFFYDMFRRPSGGSLHGDINYAAGGRRTPTGRLTPTHSGNTTPIDLPSLGPDSSMPLSPSLQQQLIASSEIVVPEIPVSSSVVVHSCFNIKQH